MGLTTLRDLWERNARLQPDLLVWVEGGRRAGGRGRRKADSGTCEKTTPGAVGARQLV